MMGKLIHTCLESCLPGRNEILRPHITLKVEAGDVVQAEWQSACLVCIRPRLQSKQIQIIK